MASPTASASPAPTVSPTPFLASFTLAPASNQDFLKTSTIAKFALVGNWPQQFAVTPLDQYGHIFTGPVPSLSATSSDPNVQASVDTHTPLAIDVVARALAGNPVQLTVTSGVASGSTSIETQQALWVLTSAVTAYQIGNATALTQLAGLNSPDAIGSDAAGDILVIDIPNVGTQRVQWFSPGGSIQSGTESFPNMSANSIALDSSGNCYFGGTTAFYEDPACSPAATLASQGFVGLGGLAFDALGDVWIGNLTGSPSATEDVYSNTALTNKLFSVTDAYSGPGKAVFDTQGNAYVPFSGYDGVNPHGGNILEIGVSGNTWSTIQTLQASEGLIAPFGLAIDAKQNLWVANDTNVLEFAAGTLAPVPGSTLTVAAGTMARGVILLPSH